MPNIDRLKAAGIVRTDATFAPGDAALVEELTEEEVDALIAINEKLGSTTLQQDYAVPGFIF